MTIALALMSFAFGNYAIENKETVKEFIINIADKFYAEDEDFREMWKSVEEEVKIEFNSK